MHLSVAINSCTINTYQIHLRETRKQVLMISHIIAKHHKEELSNIQNSIGFALFRKKQAAFVVSLREKTLRINSKTNRYGIFLLL